MCNKHRVFQLTYYEHGLHVDENIVLNDQYRGHDIPFSTQTQAEIQSTHRLGKQTSAMSYRAKAEMVPVFSEFFSAVRHFSPTAVRLTKN